MIALYIEYNAKEIFTNAFKSLVKSSTSCTKTVGYWNIRPTKTKTKKKKTSVKEKAR